MVNQTSVDEAMTAAKWLDTPQCGPAAAADRTTAVLFNPDVDHQPVHLPR